MKIGCFALNTPFSKLDVQLAQIASWGFKYADGTDNSDGASLGVAFGFAASDRKSFSASGALVQSLKLEASISTEVQLADWGRSVNC